MMAVHPLELDDRLGGIKIPVSFFYGDRDWMNKEGGISVVSKNPFKGVHSHVHIVDNSDHHMYFDNPEDFSNKILKDLENLNDIEKDSRDLEANHNTQPTAYHRYESSAALDRVNINDRSSNILL